MGKRNDEINSEQEDLVGFTSSSDLEDEEDEDDYSDIDCGGSSVLVGHHHHHHHHSKKCSSTCRASESMQFNVCKSNPTDSLTLDTVNQDWNQTNQKEYQNAQQQYQLQLQHFRKCKRTFLLLIGIGLGLLITAFTLFIVIPLYQKQLEIGRKTNNAYGSILFISPIVTFTLVIVTNLASWLFKWTVQVYKFPVMPVKKLLVISFCCGIAGTLCTISSYKRVPCHLQDPLKGAALVYSLVFYFFFCKKVMGLQKIFSATTAVVGLFISVDYGLCDEFRCHGKDSSMGGIGGSMQNQINPITGERLPHPTGWQGRAFWTLLYVIGIALWTMHLSLLEGNLVILSAAPNTPAPNNLLKTISRLVSNTDRNTDERPFDATIKSNSNSISKQRPNPLHLATWIHIISLLMLLIFGLIDVFPTTGLIKSLSQHWIDTGNTFICHLGIEPQEDINIKMNRHHKTMEYLANLTPGSILYNQTVQKLRRNKRNLENRHIKYFHHKLGHHYYEFEHLPSSLHNGLNHSLYYAAFKTKYKNLTSTQKPLISRLVINSDGNPEDRIDCSHLSSYSWILIGNYITFVIFLYYFMDLSESAVFTLSVITGALPFIGLFWSMFRLEGLHGTAFLLWAPSISGELICSLLGAPIVFLGLILLYRAHFSDMLHPPTRKSNSNPYRSLSNA